MILPDTELRGILGHITNINGFRLIICYGFFKYNLIVSEKKKCTAMLVLFTYQKLLFHNRSFIFIVYNIEKKNPFYFKVVVP